MSVFIGAVMCYAITRITSDVPFSERGKAFGIIFAVGSVGSFILSLLDGGNALGERFILIVYAILATASAGLGVYLYGKKDESIFREEEYLHPVKLAWSRKELVQFFVIFMFFVLSNIGLHFKISGSAEFESVIISRAFYAIGLLFAGAVNDRNRKMGATCAFLALGFGLLSPALQVNAGTSMLVQAIAYVFLGLPAVYRMIAFSDEAERDHGMLPFATLGVVAALIGQAVGTVAGIWLESDMTVLVCVMLVLYILTGVVFFGYFNLFFTESKKSDVFPEGDRREMAFEQYVCEKGLNSKQAQVLKYLLNGASNGEIAESLFVAESTVKYHVKNILQATSCHNRKELIEDFRNFYFNP
jgi:DNA-binding CsgD family transcriptional regulator